MTEPTSPSDTPAVTMVVDRVPRPGAEQALEAAIRDLIAAALKFPGHLGVTVTRPTPPTQPAFRIVYRFDTGLHLDAWHESEEFRRLAKAADALTKGVAQEEVLVGLEHWFTPPGAAAPPPRAKIAVVTWLGLFPLVYLLTAVATALLPPGAPLIVRVATVTVLAVVSMTYVVAPFLTRAFRPWLFPQSTAPETRTP